MNSLAKNIVATVIYYDILDYPLTSFEIWKHLMSYNIKYETYDKNYSVSLADVVWELENSNIVRKNIKEYQGFYFLEGRKKLIKKRIEHNKIIEKKFRIIKKAVYFLRFSPFIRAVAITGRMAAKNTDKKSDLDFLIVLRNGKIFTGRAWVTFLVHIFGIRRYGKKISDRICLNYFMSNENLRSGLDDLFSASENSKALHLFASSEYAFIYPVFGWETFKEFQEENKWIADWRNNYQPDKIGNMKLIGKTSFSGLIQKIGEFVFGFNFIEEFFKKWEMHRIINDPRTHQAGSFVTANDQELIFLPNPQGLEIWAEYEKRIKSFQILE